MAGAGAPQDYASPLMRKAVHDRLHPGAVFEYELLPIDESSIPQRWRGTDGGKPPTHVIRCTIKYDNGVWVEADREVDVAVPLKTGGTRDVPMTPENYFAAETKALGRALSRAGIPHRLSELQSLMRWTVALGDTPAPPAPQPQPTPRTEAADTPPEPSPHVVLLARVDALDGPVKAAFTRTAREMHGITNIAAVRDAAQIATLHTIIDNLEGTPT